MPDGRLLSPETAPTLESEREPHIRNALDYLSYTELLLTSMNDAKQAGKDADELKQATWLAQVNSNFADYALFVQDAREAVEAGQVTDVLQYAIWRTAKEKVSASLTLNITKWRLQNEIDEMDVRMPGFREQVLESRHHVLFSGSTLIDGIPRQS